MINKQQIGNINVIRAVPAETKSMQKWRCSTFGGLSWFLLTKHLCSTLFIIGYVLLTFHTQNNVNAVLLFW